MTIVKTHDGYAVEEHGELLVFATREAAEAYVQAVSELVGLNTAILEGY